MTELARIETLTDWEVAAAIEGAPRLDRAALVRDTPQESWLLRSASGEAAAHGSLWWRDTPPLGEQRTGIIGHYAASDAASARRLLDHLCARLAAEGCQVAVGPMDGTTWRRYRLVVERGAEPPFFMEPENPDDWPEHFRAAGFDVAAEYYSTVVEDLTVEDPRMARAARRLEELGVRIRPLDGARLDNELRAIHDVSLEAFRNAFLYSPISEAEFLAMYRPLVPRVDPRLVLLAAHQDRLAGYVFAAPDMNEAARGEPLRTLIVKTLAVRPDRAYAGLGALLLAHVHRNAAAMGLRRAVHALMHVSNQSRALSGHWQGRQIRRYALFARHLSS